MIRLRIFTVLVAALLLLSCSSNSKESEEGRRGKDSRDENSLFSIQKKNTGRAALAVPPDLLASSNDKVQESQEGDAGPGYEVLPEVIGATIQTDHSRSWLEIDADADVVWRKLTEFWVFEEIELAIYLPETGLMETDWFVRSKSAPAGAGIAAIAVELFDTFAARRTALDKFTVRLERNSAGGTNLYVSHRSRKKIEKTFQNLNKASEYEWVEREQDPEKVAQLLQAIVLLFDIQSDQSEDPA